MTLFFIGLITGGLFGIIAMSIFAYTNDSGKNEDNDNTKERDKK